MEVFENLNGVNVNAHTEERNGLTYLSWAWAWAEVKKRYPDAQYVIWKNDQNLPYVYDPLTGYMVYTSVTIEGVTHEMWLPVMDAANKAMKSEAYEYKVKNPNYKYAKPDANGVMRDKYGKEQPEYLTKVCDAATMFDVNKTIMRCLTKNLAMFGLGLYIYAGTDLPEGEEKPQVKYITEEEHNGFLELIRSSYADNVARNAAYKKVMAELKITNSAKMTEEQLAQAMELIKADVNGSEVEPA